MLPLHEIRDSVFVTIHMRKAGNPGVDSVLTRPSEWQPFWGELKLNKPLLLLDSHDEVRTSLGLRGGRDDQPGIIFELCNPRTEIGSRVVESNPIQNSCFIGE